MTAAAARLSSFQLIDGPAPETPQVTFRLGLPSPAPTGVCLRQLALSCPPAAVITADAFLPSISFPWSHQVSGRSVA